MAIPFPMPHTIQIGPYQVGPDAPLLVIAGPCALEAPEVNEAIGGFLSGLCRNLNLNYIFKASFDKANRSSITSDRGPGVDDGLAELARLKSVLGVPVTTDVHDVDQVAQVAEVVDLLQVPAFLCRQTDLLVACAASGLPVNVKKGQFMAPAEMTNVVKKLEDSSCRNIMLTERGTFFGYHRLVTDFIGLGDLMDVGPPVCFDVTHSTQLPGGDTTSTAGRPDRAPLLARAAASAGVHALFLECHPEPSKGRSDQSTMLQYAVVESTLRQVVAIREATGQEATASTRS